MLGSLAVAPANCLVELLLPERGVDVDLRKPLSFGELWPQGTDRRSGLAAPCVKPHGSAAVAGAVPYDGFSFSFHFEHLLRGCPILVFTTAGEAVVTEGR